MSTPVILWFRQDLRLADQPALVAACHDGPVIPVYVLDDETPGDHAMGGASRWWLHHSLAALDASLRDKGSRLILRSGKADAVLAKLVEETGAARVHAIRHYEPRWVDAETRLAEAVELALHDGNQLAPPGSIVTGAGKPFKIYTPFWRALSHHMPPDAPLHAPHAVPGPSHWQKSEALTAWRLLPTKPDWATGFSDWVPGEAGAHESLDAFRSHAARYEQTRNLPAEDGTSRFSPHLHFGELSPRQVWHRVADAGGSVRTFLSEVAWRDYAQNIIAQYPDVGRRNTRDQFDDMPWRDGTGRGQGPARLAAGSHRLSDRRRGDAPTLVDGLDAQPGADDHRQLPDQASPARLARGRALVLGLSGRRGLRQQQRQLAVDRGIGRRLEHVFTDHGAAGAEREVRCPRGTFASGSRSLPICPTRRSTIRTRRGAGRTAIPKS